VGKVNGDMTNAERLFKLLSEDDPDNPEVARARVS